MKARRIVLALGLAAAVASLSGCVTVYSTTYSIDSGAPLMRSVTASFGAESAESSAVAEATAVDTEASSGEESATVDTVSTTSTPAKLSALPKDLVQYAKDLGAKANKNAKVYLVLIGSAADQKGAQAIIDKTFSIDGDYEGYFVIEKADHFKGLSGTSAFVAVEAFKTEATANKALADNKKTFSGAKVVSVTALCSDPLPIFEDLTTQ